MPDYKFLPCASFRYHHQAMSISRHRRDPSTSTSNHSAGREDVVHETRELEHYCLMKLITSASNMKAEIEKLYAVLESLQDRIDYHEASHNARILEMRAQITDLRSKFDNGKYGGRATSQHTTPMGPRAAHLEAIMDDETINELSFSDIDTKSLIDEPEPEPEPEIIDVQAKHDVVIEENDRWDTSSHYSTISIPADWRKSKVTPVLNTNKVASVSPNLPQFPKLSPRDSIIIPEIAHLRPRSTKTIRDSLSSHCSQLFRNTQSELTELVGRFSSLNRISHQGTPGLILEEDERENSESASPVKASPAHDQQLPVRPNRPKSSLNADFLMPLSCGEPTSSFFSPQQLEFLGVTSKREFI